MLDFKKNNPNYNKDYDKERKLIDPIYKLSTIIRSRIKALNFIFCKFLIKFAPNKYKQLIHYFVKDIWILVKKFRILVKA